MDVNKANFCFSFWRPEIRRRRGKKYDGRYNPGKVASRFMLQMVERQKLPIVSYFQNKAIYQEL
jgi:hypothetical protein